MDILSRIYGGWRYIMEQKSDPRTRNWFMMNSPFPTIALSAAYIITVKVSIYLLRRTSLISIFAYINLL